MESTNQSEQYRKLQALYSDMSDSRIESMAKSMDDLTEIAQQVLQAEMSRRGLGAQQQQASPVEIARRGLEEEISALDPNGTIHQSYGSAEKITQDGGAGEDPTDPNVHGPMIPKLDPHAYDPVAIWVVTDSEQAREVMGILETAGIECYLGPENLENVDDFKGEYRDGIEIKVMKFQARHAQNGLRAALPAKPEEDSEEGEEFSVCCPKCSSTEIIFQGLVDEPGPDSKLIARNNWTCDACGYEWTDDGVEKEI